MRRMPLLGLIFLAGCGGGEATPSVVVAAKPVPADMEPRERTWYGKTADQWLAELKAPDPRQRAEAARVLPEVGPETIPAIVEALKDPQPGVVTYADIALVRFGPVAVPQVFRALADEQLANPARLVLVKIIQQNPSEVSSLLEGLRHENPRVRGQAAQAFGQLGAGEGAAGLVKLLRDPEDEVRARAAEALAKVGFAAEAVPELIAGLADPDPRVRAALPQALAQLKTVPPTAVAPLLQLLQKDEDDSTRAAAAAALARVSDGQEIIPALRQALGDASPRVRSQVVRALAQQGPVTILDLIARLKDDVAGVRRSAAVALGQVGAASEPTLAALSGLLQAPDQELRLAVVRALAQLTEAKSPGAAAALAKALRDSDSQVQQTALMALAKGGGPAAESAMPVVLEILADPKHELALRRQAMELIGQLGGTGQAAVPALTKIMKDSGSDLRLEAVATLAKLGAPAVPALAEALKDGELRSMAAHGLAQVGPAAKVAVPALVALLQDPQSPADARANAALTLAQISPAEAAPAAPALAEAAKDQGSRRQALDALIKIGAPAVPSLAQLLQFKNSVLRQETFLALRKIGKPSAPALVEIVQDGDQVKELREGAIKSLAAIGPAASMAIPALKKALDDPDADLRKAAELALRAIGEK